MADLQCFEVEEARPTGTAAAASKSQRRSLEKQVAAGILLVLSGFAAGFSAASHAPGRSDPSASLLAGHALNPHAPALEPFNLIVVAADESKQSSAKLREECELHLPQKLAEAGIHVAARRKAVQGQTTTFTVMSDAVDATALVPHAKRPEFTKAMRDLNVLLQRLGMPEKAAEIETMVRHKLHRGIMRDMPAVVMKLLEEDGLSASAAVDPAPRTDQDIPAEFGRTGLNATIVLQITFDTPKAEGISTNLMKRQIEDEVPVALEELYGNSFDFGINVVDGARKDTFWLLMYTTDHDVKSLLTARQGHRFAAHFTELVQLMHGMEIMGVGSMGAIVNGIHADIFAKVTAAFGPELGRSLGARLGAEVQSKGAGAGLEALGKQAWTSRCCFTEAESGQLQWVE